MDLALGFTTTYLHYKSMTQHNAINHLAPESFLSFLHIFAYVFIDLYYLPQFHQIHHTKFLNKVKHWFG